MSCVSYLFQTVKPPHEHLSSRTRNGRVGIVVEFICQDYVSGQNQFDALFLGFLHESVGQFYHVFLYQGFTNIVAHARKQIG